MTNLFQTVIFESNAGEILWWKTECDAIEEGKRYELTDDDYKTFAKLVALHVDFSSVLGIPTGGEAFAKALRPYCQTNKSYYPRLIVDDVLTTGGSMQRAWKSPTDIGVVIFSRGDAANWITPIFQLNNKWL